MNRCTVSPEVEHQLYLITWYHGILGIAAHELEVLMIIVIFQDFYQRNTISYQNIQEEIGKSTRTFINTIKSLKASRLKVIYQQMGENGGRIANKYDLIPLMLKIEAMDQPPIREEPAHE